MPALVTGPASRAGGGCHKAVLINEDAEAKLASFNSHVSMGGYNVENDTANTYVYKMIDRIMTYFKTLKYEVGYTAHLHPPGFDDPLTRRAPGPPLFFGTWPGWRITRKKRPDTGPALVKSHEMAGSPATSATPHFAAAASIFTSASSTMTWLLVTHAEILVEHDCTGDQHGVAHVRLAASPSSS